jgi:hypothetical protein
MNHAICTTRDSNPNLLVRSGLSLAERVGAEVSTKRRPALLAHHLAYKLPQHLSHVDGADTSTTGV